MNTHTWTFLTRLDLTSGVSIVINTKGRNANLTIGQTPENGAQDVRRYIAPQSADEIAVLAEGMELANERVAEHQCAWDAHRAASRPAQSGKPNRGPGKAPAKPVLGLKALARADAAAKGPEALAEVQELRPRGVRQVRGGRLHHAGALRFPHHFPGIRDRAPEVTWSALSAS